MIVPTSLLGPSGVSPIIGGTLPQNSNDGYVAAAYIVFLALVLAYVAIMAIRLGRVERDIRTLKATPHDGGRAEAEGEREQSPGMDQERERV